MLAHCFGPSLRYFEDDEAGKPGLERDEPRTTRRFPLGFDACKIGSTNPERAYSTSLGPRSKESSGGGRYPN